MRRVAPRPPQRRRYAELLRMQQTAGNQAVGTLLRQVVAPPKPKTDEEIWAEDWADATFADARKHFEGNDRPKGTARSATTCCARCTRRTASTGR